MKPVSVIGIMPIIQEKIMKQSPPNDGSVINFPAKHLIQPHSQPIASFATMMQWHRQLVFPCWGYRFMLFTKGKDKISLAQRSKYCAWAHVNCMIPLRRFLDKLPSAFRAGNADLSFSFWHPQMQITAGTAVILIPLFLFHLRRLGSGRIGIGVILVSSVIRVARIALPFSRKKSFHPPKKS